MFELLDGEAPVADLTKGGIQRVSEDLFLAKNMILTNKRLVLVNRRLGTYEKQYLFLKDITGLESKRIVDIGGIVVGLVFFLGAVPFLLAGKAWPVIGVALFLGGLSLLLGCVRSGIRISTTTENYFFPLARTFSPGRADSFLDLVTRETARQKSIA